MIRPVNLRTHQAFLNIKTQNFFIFHDQEDINDDGMDVGATGAGCLVGLLRYLEEFFRLIDC